MPGTYLVPWMSTLLSEIDLYSQRWLNVLLPAHLVAILPFFLFGVTKELCSAFSLGLMKSAQMHIQIHEDNVGTLAKLAIWLNEML